MAKHKMNFKVLNNKRHFPDSLGPHIVYTDVVFQKMEKLEGLGIRVFVQFNETAHAKVQMSSSWVPDFLKYFLPPNAVFYSNSRQSMGNIISTW